MLTFNEERHEYRWNGQLVPNVTRIIGHLTDYSRIQPDVLKRAQDEGKAIHKMIELDCNRDLDVDNLPEWLRPRHEAWCRFKEETGFECIIAEKQMFHESLGYAGTPDLICVLRKLKTGAGIWNPDAKRSLYAGPAIGLQTAGYTELWNRQCSKTLRVVHRGALVLNDNCTYRLTEYKDQDDWPSFLACLQQYRWREKHYGTA